MRNKMKRILLVEDDPFLIDIYSQKLRKEGFEVEVISDGEEVLGALQNRKPDLLILDIVLPRLDGWEILKRINENHHLKDLKIVIISNLGQKEDIERGQELGALKYFIKAHFTPSQVAEEIKKVLK